MTPAADRNLLFGLLALQTGLVTREALLAALRAWVLDKDRLLREILCERAALAADDSAPLEALVVRHLERHGEAGHCLAALASLGTLCHDLERIADPDLCACLARLGAGSPGVTQHQPQLTSTLDYPGIQDAAATLLVNGAAADEASAWTNRSGSRYRVLRAHARGGLGEVFVALDEELQREVALKEIRAQHADRRDSRARFLLEAEVTGRLEHPGVVPVYGLGTYPDGRPFYAMRFIKGESLKDAIKRFHGQPAGKGDGGAGLELRQLLRRFGDVCNAVAYAHSRGILHRDLKPDNIMLGAFGETLVVDWGLAKTVGCDATDSSAAGEGALEPARASASAPSLVGSVIGTPQYMPPEQAAGKVDELGPASDVYSLGATLYHLLTGKRPFPDDDVPKVLRMVQSGAFPTPREISPAVPAALEAVCLKAMALRPEERYASPRALAADIDRWLADEPVSAYREPLRLRLARWRRRHAALVTGMLALVFTALVAVGVSALLLSREQKAKLAEQERAREALEGRALALEDRALAQVDALLNADSQAVRALLEALEPFRDQIRPRLRKVLANRSALNVPLQRQHRIRASLALLGDDPSQATFLRDCMLDPRLDPDEMLLLRDALTPYRQRLVARLWQEADRKGSAARRFRAWIALAAFDPDSPRWEPRGAQVVDSLLAADPLYLGDWVGALHNVREFLLVPLERAFRDRRHLGRGSVAATVLCKYVDRPKALVDLLADGDESQFALLLPHVREKGKDGIAELESELTRQPSPGCRDEERNALARRQANCAVALLRLGQPARVWPLLRHTPYPDTRSHLIHRLGPLGVDVGVLAGRLDGEEDVSARRALVLALGEYTEAQLAGKVPAGLIERLTGWYRQDPDSGLHAATGWLLGQTREGPEKRRFDWGQAGTIREIDRGLRGQPPAPGRRWYVNAQGQTMVLLGPATFPMGAPETEPEYETDETLHLCRIKRTFALGSTEVTVAQFQRFLKDHRYPQKHSPDPDGPIISVTWYEAVQYCRWLSEREGIAEDQMCYPSVAEIEKCKPSDDRKREGQPLKLPANYLSRTGYRLPTEAEWEYACRAGARTSRPHGVSAELLGGYAWDVRNALARAWPVGQKRPNDFGLFDMHGNAAEWCQDEYGPYPAAKDGAVDDVEHALEVTPRSRRVLRGAPFYPRPAPLRSAYRYWHMPSDRFSTIGFRVARTHR